MKNLDNTLRELTTDQIYQQLQENFSSYILIEQITLCDELLKREMPIKHVPARFEFMIRKMKTADLLYIDSYDFNFSKAAVFIAIDEIIKRGKKPLEWLYISKFEGQKGPVNRLEIDQLIDDSQLDENSYLWRIGMDDWKPLDKMPYLTLAKYYDQEFDDTENGIPPKIDEPTYTSNQRRNVYAYKQYSSSYSIVPGIMELISFPIWFILIFTFFFTGFNSKMGVMLPFIFSVLVLISVIPVGIGLISRKKWAWSIKIATGLLTIFIILFKLIVDQAGGWWNFILLYQLIIVGLLYYGRDAYEISTP